jgi:protein-tyrosine-phosphatase
VKADGASVTVLVRSAGSDPADQLNPAVVAAMSEWGIDLRREFPEPFTDEAVQAADAVVTWARRAGRTSSATVSGWVVTVVCLIAANTWLYLAAPIIPAAMSRPGAVAFAIGMVIL